MTPPNFVAGAARLLAAATAAVLLVSAAPAAAHAQQVYEASQLTVAPKIASPSEAARVVSQSYPEPLRRAGINGTVELECVVGPDGKVEGSSIQIIAASPPALADAAKKAVGGFRFKPGQVNGEAVRTKVAIPIVYKAS